MSKAINVTLTFNENDLNEMLMNANIVDNTVTVDMLNEQQFNELKELLKDTASNFVEEIVDNTVNEYEWLSDYLEQFEDEL